LPYWLANCSSGMTKETLSAEEGNSWWAMRSAITRLQVAQPLLIASSRVSP